MPRRSWLSQGVACMSWHAHFYTQKHTHKKNNKHGKQPSVWYCLLKKNRNAFIKGRERCRHSKLQSTDEIDQGLCKGVKDQWSSWTERISTAKMPGIFHRFYRLSTISITILMCFSTDKGQRRGIPKIYREMQMATNCCKNITKENTELGGNIHHDLKCYYNAIIIKIVLPWCKIRHRV